VLKVDAKVGSVTAPDPQDSSFFALTEDEADPERFFPVRVLFDSAEYRKATESVDPEFIPHIDDLQSKIKEALIPIELLRTDDRAKVAIVFERINHQGVPLDTLRSCSQPGPGVTISTSSSGSRISARLSKITGSLVWAKTLASCSGAARQSWSVSPPPTV